MPDNTRFRLGHTDTHWLQVDLHQMQFLVPGEDTLTLSQWQPSEQATRLHCGTLLFEQDYYPVFALDAGFRLQPEGSPQCPGALLLETGGDIFGLACRGVTKLQGELPARFTVPACMHGRRQPFNEFVLLQNRATPLTNAETLAHLLKQLGARFIPRPMAGSQRELG